MHFGQKIRFVTSAATMPVGILKHALSQFDFYLLVPNPGAVQF